MVVCEKILTFLLLLELASALCDVRPRITGSTAKESSRYTEKINLFSTYGEDVTIVCSAPEGNLEIIGNYSDIMKTQTKNKNTLQLIVRKPDVGQHQYRCIDILTRCEDILTFKVRPAVSVISERSRIIRLKDNDIYFVPRGDVYKVFCSTNDIQSYSMFSGRSWTEEIPLDTEIVNKTTLVSVALANDTSYSTISCKGNTHEQFVKLEKDYFPDVHDFNCAILDGFVRFFFSWIGSSIRHTHKLWLLNGNKRPKLICDDYSEKVTKTCLTIIRGSKYSSNMTVRMETCNLVFCNDQTFSFYRDVMKRNTLSHVKIFNTSLNSAVVTWRNRGYFSYSNCVFKVEYRVLAMGWQQANTSTYSCEKKDCSFLLNLPCSDMPYEVRVYVKGKSAEERFWSDPSPSAFFFTSSKNTGVPDQGCHESFLVPITSVESALSEINKLLRFTVKETLSLKGKISVLKRKMAKVQALRKLAKV